MTDKDYFYISELRDEKYKVKDIVKELQDGQYKAILYMETRDVMGHQIKMDDNLRNMLLSYYQKKLSELEKEFEELVIQRGVSNGRE